MKNFKRVFSLIIMFALTLSFAFGGRLANVISVKAASVTTGSTLTIKAFPSTGTIGQEITIPKGESSSGNVTVEIKDPHSKILTSADYTIDGNNIKFVAKKLGYYTVQYFVEGSFTKSQVYNIKIEGSKPTIEFEENSQIFLPDTIASSTVVTLPKPIVTKSNGERLLNFNLKSSVDATSNDVSVSVRAPIIDETLGDYKYVPLTYDADGNVQFSPIKNSKNEYVYGTYTICYSYQESSYVSTSKYVNIDVEKDYEDVINNIKMTFVWENSESIPTSGNLNSAIKLPKPIAQDKSRNNKEIPSYTNVTVQFIDKNGVAHNYDFDSTNFTFTPKDKTENGAYYKVEYTISNFFGIDTITRVFQIRNVTDTERPNYFIVDEYEKLDDDVINDSVDLTDVSYKIPSKIVASYTGDIVIPALFGTDNYKKYSELTLARYWKTDKKTIRLDNATYPVNKNLVLTNESIDEDVRDCLRTAGTYTLRYEISDGTNVTYKDFEIQIVERNGNAVDTLAPEISNFSLTKTAYTNDIVNFKVPSVADYMLVDGEKVSGTQRCLVEAVYYYGNDYAGFLSAFRNGSSLQAFEGYYGVINKDKDDSSYYSFEAPDSAYSSTIYVVVRAVDNAKYLEPNTETIAQNNVSIKEGKIRLINIDPTSVEPPHFESVVHSSVGDYAQKELIEICELSADNRFSFECANADFAKITVNVYDPNGKDVTVKGKEVLVNSSKTQITLKSATFMSTRNGEYVIVISATDVANNSTVVAYKIMVNDTIAPVINEKSAIPSTMVVGTTIELPSIIVLDNGEEIVNLAEEEISFEGFNENLSYDFTSGDNKFTPYEIGTYTFKYIASDGINEVTLIKSIEVVADTSTEGKLYLDDSNWNPTRPLIEEVINSVETGRYKLVKVPRLECVNTKGPITSYKVKVVGPNNKEMIVTENDGVFEFEPSAKDGKYTVTYTVRDSAGQTATLEKTLKIGDLVKPDITFADEKINLPTSAKLGSTFSINASDIDYTDDKSSKSEIILTITVKDTSGKVTTIGKDSNNLYSYKFDNAGSYILTYTVTDKAGNSKEITTEIVVGAEKVNETNVTTIIGYVLIAVSVAFLLGVVAYFIVTNKKGIPSKEKAKNNAKKVIE